MKAIGLYLVAMVRTSIPQERVFYDQTGTVSISASSHRVQVTLKSSNLVSASNDDFASCSCDLTQGACDAQCCCDTECAKSTIEIWKKAGSCSTEIQTIETLKNCTDKINAIKVDDIQDGLRYFTKFGSSLMCSAKEGTVSDTNTFIANKYPKVTSNTEFDALLKTDNTYHKIDN